MNRKADSWGYLIVWEFHVRPRRKKAFLRAYGADGVWAQLFSRDQHYLGTELILDLKSQSTYWTLDFWTSRQAYANFRKTHAAEYKAIDARCEAFTKSEREIGRYIRVR